MKILVMGLPGSGKSTFAEPLAKGRGHNGQGGAGTRNPPQWPRDFELSSKRSKLSSRKRHESCVVDGPRESTQGGAVGAGGAGRDEGRYDGLRDPELPFCFLLA